MSRKQIENSENTTTPEVALKLTKLLDKIREKGDYFEFGGNVEFTTVVLNHIKVVLKNLREYDDQFSFGNCDASSVHKYFICLGHIRRLESAVKEIIETQYGSTKNTREVIELLELCIESFYEMTNNNPKEDF
jgi:hypothetical protein